MEEFYGMNERKINEFLSEYGLRLCDETGEEIPEDDFIEKDSLYDEDGLTKVKYTKEEVKNLKAIAKRIGELKQNGKKFNRYDYFIMGGVSIPRAISVVYSMNLDNRFEGKEYADIKEFLAAQKMIPVNKNRDFIINTYYQFGSYVISMQEKEVIWNSLIANGVLLEDIDDIVFSGAVREYAIEQGLIENLKPKKRKRQKRK